MGLSTSVTLPPDQHVLQSVSVHTIVAEFTIVLGEGTGASRRELCGRPRARECDTFSTASHDGRGRPARSAVLAMLSCHSLKHRLVLGPGCEPALRIAFLLLLS